MSTAINSGNAITIATNNVTIDCIDFNLGGWQAGDGSEALEIYADYSQNATVRHYNVRGFYKDIYLIGGAGHLVGDNRVDNALTLDLYVSGDSNLVQRNSVFDTGGASATIYSQGMSVSGDVIDNTDSAVFVNVSGGFARGIYAFGRGTEVRLNRVRGVMGAIGHELWHLGGSRRKRYRRCESRFRKWRWTRHFRLD